MVTNRRQSHRVEADVLLRCGPACDEKSPIDPVHERLRNRLFDVEADLQASLLRLRRQSPALVTAFELLTAKVDVLADAVEAVVTRSGSDDLQRHRVVLSASGISFDSEARFEPGDEVYLSIVLLPQMEAIDTLGNVVRIDPAPKGCHVAIQFADLSADAERRLNRHVINIDKRSLSDS